MVIRSSLLAYLSNILFDLGTLRALAARHPPKKPPATQPEVVLEQQLLAAPRRVTPARRRQSHHFRSLHERFSGRNPHWF